MKKSWALGLVMLLLAPLPATAQDNDPRQQLDAVVRCLGVASVDERVRCYDAAATTLRDSMRRGEVTVSDARTANAVQRSPTQSRFAASIVSASWDGGVWRMELSNGQTWVTLDRKRSAPPRAGTAVRVHRNFVRSFWMDVEGDTQHRVRRAD